MLCSTACYLSKLETVLVGLAWCLNALTIACKQGVSVLFATSNACECVVVGMFVLCSVCEAFFGL
eukprot:m.386785 g.386785  ORF g.386785 m.386785 type:complete len:65 (+) comp20058_c1_seq1:35-229(+)